LIRANILYLSEQRFLTPGLEVFVAAVDRFESLVNEGVYEDRGFRWWS
jgi:hypothetical protein